MFKRKGQIVPRNLCKSVEKKAQHLVKFGADVEIKGKEVKLLSDGCFLVIHGCKHVLKKKRQRTVKGFIFRDIVIIRGVDNKNNQGVKVL